MNHMATNCWVVFCGTRKKKVSIQSTEQHDILFVVISMLNPYLIAGTISCVEIGIAKLIDLAVRSLFKYVSIFVVLELNAVC